MKDVVSLLEQLGQEIHWVIKRRRPAERFNATKLLESLDKPLVKVPNSTQHKLDILSRVLEHVRTTGKSEIQARDLGEVVLKGLRHVGPRQTFLYGSVFYGYSHEIIDLIQNEVIPSLDAPPQLGLSHVQDIATSLFDPETLAPNGIRVRLQTLEAGLSNVSKRDRTPERFNQDKFWRGIWRPLHKIPGALEHTARIVAEFEMWVGSRKSISSSEIGEFILNKLWAIDPLAYLRYAAVHLRNKPTELRQAFLNAIPVIEARVKELPAWDEYLFLPWLGHKLSYLAAAQLSNTLRDYLGVKVCYTPTKPLPAHNFLGVLVFSPLTIVRTRMIRPPAIPMSIWKDLDCWSSCLSQHEVVAFLRELPDILNQAGQCEYCCSSLTSKGVTSPGKALAFEILSLIWKAMIYTAQVKAQSTKNMSASSDALPGRIFWLSLPCPRGLQNLMIIP